MEQRNKAFKYWEIQLSQLEGKILSVIEAWLDKVFSKLDYASSRLGYGSDCRGVGGEGGHEVVGWGYNNGERQGFIILLGKPVKLVEEIDTIRLKRLMQHEKLYKALPLVTHVFKTFIVIF